MKNILISQRHPEYANHPDSDIKTQLRMAERERKELMIDFDCAISILDLHTIEEEIKDIDRLIFRLDDELCARGL